MRRLLPVLLLAACWFALPGCGAGSPGGPAMSGRVNEPGPSGPDPLSNEIMMRDAKTNRAMVKHIVVGADRKELAVDLLRRVRAGEAIEPLMAEFSTDPGSAASGESYEVRPDSQLVFEFKRLGLRLEVGEAGLVRSQFGWHVMKRIE
jgi:parvulin-like peptidyl-prolyl isomerase